MLGGSKELFASALKKILGDDSDFTRLKKAKAHLERAKEVLARGTFEGDAKDWYRTGKARDGVVSRNGKAQRFAMGLPKKVLEMSLTWRFQSIFANARHLNFDKWPDDPESVYSTITGVTRSIDDPWVEMYMEHWNSIEPYAFLLRDHNRTPRFEKTGEILAVNPHLLDKWENEPYQDMLDTPITWEIVTDRELYKEHNAVPADEPSDETQCTPVDLLLLGPQPTILHEVSNMRHLDHPH